MTRDELKAELIKHVGPSKETTNHTAFPDLIDKFLEGKTAKDLDEAFNTWNEVMFEIVQSLETKH